MLNRINQLFQDSPKNLLSIYFCAGCPNLDGTADVIRAFCSSVRIMIKVLLVKIYRKLSFQSVTCENQRAPHRAAPRRLRSRRDAAYFGCG